MLELLIVACLVGQPEQCEEFPLPFSQPMSMVQCLLKGSLYAQRWANENPDWQMRRWSCGFPQA